MQKHARLVEIAPHTYMVGEILENPVPGSVRFPVDLANVFYHRKKEIKGILYNPFAWKAILNGLEMKYRISVILIHYNRKRDLKICLDELEKQDLPKQLFEVVVADDGTKDGVEEETKNRPYPIKVAVNPRSDFEEFRNPSTVKNIALAKAEGEFVVLHSAEVIPKNRNALSRILQRHERGARRVICDLKFLEKGISKRIRSDPEILQKETHLQEEEERDPWKLKTFCLVDALWVGGWSQCFEGHGAEDSEFSNRMDLIGMEQFQVQNENEVLYVHLFHPSVYKGLEENRSRLRRIRGRKKAVHGPIHP